MKSVYVLVDSFSNGFLKTNTKNVKEHLSL